MKRFTVVAAAAALLTLTGCSGSSDQPAAASSAPQSSASAPTSGPASATADPTQNGSVDAGVGLEALDHPIATVTAKTGMADDPSGSVKVDLLGLDRKDKLLVLTAAVTPTTTLSKPVSLFTALGSHSWNPALVDAVHLKEYSVVNAQNRLMRTSDLGPSAASGQPMFVYAVFAAPPPDVTSINVLFADGVPMLKDVPLR